MLTHTHKSSLTISVCIAAGKVSLSMKTLRKKNINMLLFHLFIICSTGFAVVNECVSAYVFLHRRQQEYECAMYKAR